MADSTTDVSKMKVVDLRKELKSRGLSYAGDKAELIARLQSAISQDEHGDITLDSDEIDSDGVLEDEDDKSQNDILDESAVDTLNEDLALDEQAPAKLSTESKPQRILKRKITSNSDKAKDEKSDNKDVGAKKIVLNRAPSIPNAATKTTEEKTEITAPPTNVTTEKVKITVDIDPKARLEMRAKRFGLPVKMSEAERKEARKQRFSGNTTGTSTINSSTGSLTENLDKLKQRAERFGQSVSSLMTEIENKERLEKRKAKFSAVK